MALGATMYRLRVALSDVDRGVYESLDLRLARHPSESARYLLLRAFAYCLSYAEGIAFSKGGLSSTEEPPIVIRDATGTLVHWIEIGAPSAERLHRASKACQSVALFTAADLKLLRREASSREIHRVEAIALYHVDPGFLDALEAVLDRNLELELVRNAAVLYVTVGAARFETPLEEQRLLLAE
jgi:uncharacterized protein YaeQ